MAAKLSAFSKAAAPSPSSSQIPRCLTWAVWNSQSSSPERWPGIDIVITSGRLEPRADGLPDDASAIGGLTA